MKFSKFRHLLLVIGMAGFASPALAQDEERQSCEPAYAVDLAEVAAGVRAKLVADTFKGLADELAAEAGELDSASVNLGARYSVTAAGGLMQDAYLDTIDSYFCHLRDEWAADPVKLQNLEDKRIELEFLIQDWFDPSVWQIENRSKRQRVRSEILAAERGAAFNSSEVSAALPEYNFDTVMLTELVASVDIPNIVGIDACAGMLRASVRAVEPELLVSLQGVRGALVQYLGRSERTGQLYMWRAITSHMSDQLSRASGRREQRVSRDQVVCVQKAAADAAVLAAQPTQTQPALDIDISDVGGRE